MTKIEKEKCLYWINRTGIKIIGFYDQKIWVAPSSAEVNLQNISRPTSMMHPSLVLKVLSASTPPMMLCRRSISADVVSHDETEFIGEAFAANFIVGLT